MPYFQRKPAYRPIADGVKEASPQSPVWDAVKSCLVCLGMRDIIFEHANIAIKYGRIGLDSVCKSSRNPRCTYLEFSIGWLKKEQFRAFSPSASPPSNFGTTEF